MLTKYKNIFPTYIDYTALHSMEVFDFCNKLIGSNISHYAYGDAVGDSTIKLEIHNKPNKE